MIKLLLFIYVVIEIVRFIRSIFSNLFRFKSASKSELRNTSRDWYGICDNCGKEAGLHNLEGNRYCAECHARLKTEKMYRKKQESK